MSGSQLGELAAAAAQPVDAASDVCDDTADPPCDEVVDRSPDIHDDTADPPCVEAATPSDEEVIDSGAPAADEGAAPFTSGTAPTTPLSGDTEEPAAVAVAETASEHGGTQPACVDSAVKPCGAESEPPTEQTTKDTVGVERELTERVSRSDDEATVCEADQSYVATGSVRPEPLSGVGSSVSLVADHCPATDAVAGRANDGATHISMTASVAGPLSLSSLPEANAPEANGPVRARRVARLKQRWSMREFVAESGGAPLSASPSVSSPPAPRPRTMSVWRTIRTQEQARKHGRSAAALQDAVRGMLARQEPLMVCHVTGATQTASQLRAARPLGDLCGAGLTSPGRPPAEEDYGGDRAAFRDAVQLYNVAARQAFSQNSKARKTA
jgi:hypothetical protein